MTVADFNVGGGHMFIGDDFENLLNNGAAKKILNSGFEGSTGVRLQGDHASAQIESKPRGVNMYDRLEATFMFRFLNNEAEEAQSTDPDHFLVEYQLNGGDWEVAGDYIYDGVTYTNNQWNVGCFQMDLPSSANTFAMRFVADGDNGNQDFVYLDSISLVGRPKPGQCTDNSDAWPYIFVSDFNLGGGALYIGDQFEELVNGGAAKKINGAGFEGTTGDNEATSYIATNPQDVSTYNRVEGNFMFKFYRMEAEEALTNDPDNLLVEIQIDGGAWEVAGDFIMDGITYNNNDWNVGCFQMDLPENASTLVVRFTAGGDTDDFDFIYLDNISIAGQSKFSFECSDDSTAWPVLFFESFEYGYGAQYIGTLFQYGGPEGDDDSIKVAHGTPGKKTLKVPFENTKGGIVSHTGTRSIKLKDNSDGSRIHTVPVDVSLASRVELTFYFKFRGFDESDNFYVERMFDGESDWSIVSNVVKMGDNYENEQWYKHCVQFDIAESTATLAIQVRADGQEGDSDIIFVDDFELKYIEGAQG
ncbi:MAG: hypothetical protein SGILL_003783 [Bacillariaceae sp.]